MSDSKADIMRRAHHLAIKIYPKILCIKSDLDFTRYITIDGIASYPRFTWPRSPQYKILLSYELLTWMTMDGRIPFSLTNFITTQELSRRFYVSPDIFHTQITEYSLLTLNECALFSFPSTLFIKDLPSNRRNCLHDSLCSYVELNWSFMDHLSRSLPTEKIFDLLRQSIRSESLRRHYSAELVFDMLKVIIKWLKVSFMNATDNLNPLRLTIRFTLGTWFQATERLVRSLPG